MFQLATYPSFRLGSKAFTLLVKVGMIGYCGVVGTPERTGSVGSRNRTLPGAPKSAGKVLGAMEVETVRPWLPAYSDVTTFMPSRTLEVAKPPRNTDAPSWF